MASMYPARRLKWTAIGLSTIFMIPGLKMALQQSYLYDPEREDITAIVTGATGNIGKSICHDLAKRKCRVIMACRDMEKCKSIRRYIVLDTGNKKVACRHIDLEDIDSINKFADDIIEKEPYIDVLINNAAVKETKGKELTKYGIEKHFFVNFLAPYLLTFRLLDKLAERAKITGDSRVINVVGTPKKNWRLDINDINFNERKFSSQAAYRQSKLALAYFTILLEKFNREKNNSVYVFGWTPSTNKIVKSMDLETGDLHHAKELLELWTKYHPSQLSSAVANVALNPQLVKEKKNGKLFNYWFTSVGFNGAWGIAAKNEVYARRVWNMAAEMLLTAPTDQLKQAVKSNPSEGTDKSP